MHFSKGASTRGFDQWDNMTDLIAEVNKIVSQCNDGSSSLNTSVGIHNVKYYVDRHVWIRLYGIISTCPKYVHKFSVLEKRQEITPEKIKEMNYWDEVWEEFIYRPGGIGYNECKDRFENKRYI